MSELKVNLEVVQELTCSLSGETVEDFILIHQLPVDDEGKYQYESYVVLHLPTRKFYMFRVQRSGSYFSAYDHEYNEDEDGMVSLNQVRLMPVSGCAWQSVK